MGGYTYKKEHTLFAVQPKAYLRWDRADTLQTKYEAHDRTSIGAGDMSGSRAAKGADTPRMAARKGREGYTGLRVYGALACRQVHARMYERVINKRVERKVLRNYSLDNMTDMQPQHNGWDWVLRGAKRILAVLTDDGKDHTWQEVWGRACELNPDMKDDTVFKLCFSIAWNEHCLNCGDKK